MIGLQLQMAIYLAMKIYQLFLPKNLPVILIITYQHLATYNSFIIIIDFIVCTCEGLYEDDNYIFNIINPQCIR